MSLLGRDGRVAKGGALLRRWTSRPRGFESHSLRFGLYGLLIFGPVAPKSAAQVAVDGWPSGLRRTIGNRVGSRPRGFESHPVRVGMTRFVFGAWLSPVERCVRVAEVPGSNPGAPIR